jgi:hypothetical protein
MVAQHGALELTESQYEATKERFLGPTTGKNSKDGGTRDRKSQISQQKASN